jgi:lysophospholipase L1-like esterase
MTPPPKTLRRRRSRYRGPMPYRYDRKRPAWVPLSLVANGVLLSWLGCSLVQPSLYPQHQVQAFPLGSALLNHAADWAKSSQLADRQPRQAVEETSQSTILAQSTSPSGVRLTYDQWVEQLKQEASAVALQKASNVSILAGDSLSLWFPENLLPRDQIWLNQGISGETSQGLMRRLGLWKGLEPKRVFVMIGINDLLKGTSSEQVLKNQRTILQQLRQAHPQAAIVVQSVLPHGGSRATWEGRAKLARIPNGQIIDLNRQLAAIAKAEGVHYLDLNPLFTDSKGLLRQDLTTDGLHLNPQGYLVWSTAMNFFSLQELDGDVPRRAALPEDAESDRGKVAGEESGAVSGAVSGAKAAQPTQRTAVSANP